MIISIDKHDLTEMISELKNSKGIVSIDKRLNSSINIISLNKISSLDK